MSRAINREYLFGEIEKEAFVRIMRKVEAFSGVEVITFVVMSNHFHILLAENTRKDLSDQELIDRLRNYYGATSKTFRKHEAQLLQLQEDGSTAAIAAFHERFQKRMNNFSEFMKTLKQCFTQWYNKINERCGTVWSDRFKSVLVQPGKDALSQMAAYIDLNPVRADLVKDPIDYRWCGYCEAMAGKTAARSGLKRLYTSDGTLALGFGMDGEVKWHVVRACYRMLIYQGGVSRSDHLGNPVRNGFSAEKIRTVLASGGSLPWHELAKCRVRYFTEGVMLGSAEYVQTHEKRLRQWFGLREPRLANSIRECSDTPMHVFRRYWANQVIAPRCQPSGDLRKGP